MQFTGMEWSTLSTLAGLAAAAITVLYVLKLRKRRIEVPFSPLWREILLEHKQQSDWWRRLRRLLSWLLHIVLLALLAFALLDPHMEDEVVEGRHMLILIDASASMASTDVSGGADRLDVAKNKAREILETMGPDDRAMLVAFSNQVQPLSPFVSEASILEAPLREIRVGATGTEFGQAIRFAADSMADKSSGELVIISDGSGADLEALSEVEFGEGVTVRHLKVGESGDNVAITAFNVRRYIANKLDFELFLRVQSYFERPVDVEIQIFADGRLVDTKDVELAANGVHQQFYPSQAVAGERLEARVRLKSTDARDVFPLDDRAYALLPPVSKADVLVVTEGNLYVEGPLLLNSNLNVKRIKPSEYPDARTDWDMVVFDRFTPPMPERGNFFYISPSGETSPWPTTGTVNDPIITRTTRSHPLMRWITLKDVNIGSASRLKTSREDDVVASSAVGAPILIARPGDELRMAALAFDVRNSDFPLRVAFPVLLLNLVDWFAAGDESLVESYSTGDTWSVPLQTTAQTVKVESPSGESADVPVYENRAIVYGDETGFWTIGSGSDAKRVAANLVNPEESRVASQELTFGEREVQRDTSALVFERNELWIWALLAFLALILVEWVTYNRRITV